MIIIWIYSKYITVKGRRIYAHEKGLKAFRFWVDDDKVRKNKKEKEEK